MLSSRGRGEPGESCLLTLSVSGPTCTSGSTRGRTQVTEQPQQDWPRGAEGDVAPEAPTTPSWQSLPRSMETSLATEAEAAESVEEFRSGVASGASFLVTITACRASRAWRRMASASLWVAPLRDLPLMERTSLPF